jgi:hypothetical protein
MLGKLLIFNVEDEAFVVSALNTKKFFLTFGVQFVKGITKKDIMM